jgi:DNA-directed RNA polymerase specialized sigma54-like protein
MKLIKKYGYTLKEIADYVGIHFTTVSRVIKAKKDEN